jgi:hypothetical protein
MFKSMGSAATHKRFSTRLFKRAKPVLGAQVACPDAADCFRHLRLLAGLGCVGC